ncbi:E3 binding domain-containing protein [Bacillus sp. SL00103]
MEIQEVSGTGPKGRVQKRDVEAVVHSSEKDQRISPLAEKVAAVRLNRFSKLVSDLSSRQDHEE